MRNVPLLQGTRSYIRALAACILALRACSAFGTENQAPQTHTSDYQRVLAKALTSVYSGVDESRMGVIKVELSTINGRSAELLRILWWACNEDAEQRTELLTQWLCGLETIPSLPDATARLDKLLTGRTSESIATRHAEVEAALSCVATERKKRAPVQCVTYVPASNEWVACPPLEGLTEDTLFGMHNDTHISRIESLPTAPRWEDGNPFALAFYRMLWTTEANTDARMVLERQIFRIAFDMSESLPDLPCGDVALEFTDSEKETRLTSLQTTLDKLRTDPSGDGVEAETLYRQAQRSYFGDDCEAALEGFCKYLRQYPSGAYVASAQYAKARCLQSVKRYQDAVKEYQTFRAAHPMNAHVAHSIFYEAVCLRECGEEDRAVRLLRDVVADYPESVAADQARFLLGKARRE